MISFDSMSHIQVTLMQEVGSHGLGQLCPCGFAGYSPTPGCFHGLALSVFGFSRCTVQAVSDPFIKSSGLVRLTITTTAQEKAAPMTQLPLTGSFSRHKGTQDEIWVGTQPNHIRCELHASRNLCFFTYISLVPRGYQRIRAE